MPHDTFPIMSNYSTGGLLCERMPDIIGVFLSFLCEKYQGYGNFDLTRMSSEVAAGRVPNEGEKTSKTGLTKYPRTEWKDIHLTMELKYSKPIYIPKSWKKEDVLEASNVQETTATSRPTPSVEAEVNPRLAAIRAAISQAQTTANSARIVESEPAENEDAIARKRPREEEGTTAMSERPRKTSRGSDGQPLAREPTQTRPPPDVQCAYYGAERLAASFFITHSIVVLMEGTVTVV